MDVSYQLLGAPLGWQLKCEKRVAFERETALLAGN